MNSKLYKIRYQDAIDKLIQSEDFMKLLSEKLFLDESLAGECDSVSYLGMSMKEAYLETVSISSRERVARTRERIDREWLAGSES